MHLNQDDVQVTLTDEHGNPLPLKDVDLQLKLPAKCKDTSFKGLQGVILHSSGEYKNHHREVGYNSRSNRNLGLTCGLKQTNKQTKTFK